MNPNLTLKFLLFLSLVILNLNFSSLVFAQEIAKSGKLTVQEAIQNVGILNIETRELGAISTYPNQNLKDFVSALMGKEQSGGPIYRVYDVSFFTYRTNHLILGIEESHDHSSLDILQEVKAILGEMPARWLNEVHFIVIKKSYSYFS